MDALFATPPLPTHERRSFYRRITGAIGNQMPKGLYARALIIIIAPMVLLQSVLTFVFLERHWQTVTRRLSTVTVQNIAMLIDIYRNYPFSTEILVASVRHPMHIVEAAKMGADICTCPASVLEACFNHPLTSLGLEKFIKDWEKSQAARV